MFTKLCLTNLIKIDKKQEYAIALKVLDELKSTPTNMGTIFEKTN